MLPGIGECYPRRCPTLPEALGTYNQGSRLIVPVFSGMSAHVRGHESSCTRGLVVNLFRILIEFQVGVSTCLTPVQHILLLFWQEARLS